MYVFLSNMHAQNQQYQQQHTKIPFMLYACQKNTITNEIQTKCNNVENLFLLLFSLHDLHLFSNIYVHIYLYIYIYYRNIFFYFIVTLSFSLLFSNNSRNFLLLFMLHLLLLLLFSILSNVISVFCCPFIDIELSRCC